MKFIQHTMLLFCVSLSSTFALDNLPEENRDNIMNDQGILLKHYTEKLGRFASSQPNQFSDDGIYGEKIKEIEKELDLTSTRIENFLLTGADSQNKKDCAEALEEDRLLKNRILYYNKKIENAKKKFDFLNGINEMVSEIVTEVNGVDVKDKTFKVNQLTLKAGVESEIFQQKKRTMERAESILAKCEELKVNAAFLPTETQLDEKVRISNIRNKALKAIENYDLYNGFLREIMVGLQKWNTEQVWKAQN